MRVVEISAPGKPEVLRVNTRALPLPKGGEILIRVEAAGVNRPDVLQRMGLYPVPAGASDVRRLACGEGAAAGGFRDVIICRIPHPYSPREKIHE
jgi:hypothetical protein